MTLVCPTIIFRLAASVDEPSCKRAKVAEKEESGEEKEEAGNEEVQKEVKAEEVGWGVWGYLSIVFDSSRYLMDCLSR